MQKTVYLLLMSLISAIVSGQSLYQGNQCILKSEFIYREGEVPFPSCHASTIVETTDGFLAAWFGGTAERSPDVGIWISEFMDGKWSTPDEAANGVVSQNKRYPCWNPVLFNSGTRILLFYKEGPSPSSWWGEMKISYDKGRTWSAAKRLPDNILGPIKNKPVLLENGTLLCPSSSENHGWRVHIESTTDSGSVWTRTKALNKRNLGAIQPTLLPGKNNSLEMLCRSTSGKILMSWSNDQGKSWSSLKETTLPNPNSGIDGLTLKDGRKLVVYNHLLKGRHFLNIAISDDGITWKAAVVLENDQEGKEYSYPAVIQSSDGLLHITYTWNRRMIKHVIIDPSKISACSFNGDQWPD